MSVDILLILQTNIILVFVSPRDFERNFQCPVPHSKVILGPKDKEMGSYKSLSES